jgi:hypothetical protein
VSAKRNDKVKVKLFLCLNKYHAMKTYGGAKVYHHTVLTMALGGGEWADLCPNHFTTRKRAPNTHWIGGWVVPRDGLDVVKRKNH